MWNLAAVVVASVLTAVSASDSCDWSSSDGDPTEYRVICRPDHIRREFEISGASVRSSTRLVSLAVKCGADSAESYVTNRTFAGLPGLIELAVENCRLATLPSEAFRQLSQLRTLSLRTFNSDSNLVVERQALQQLRSLEKLDLSHNRLWTLPSGLLCPLASLKQVNLSHNHVQNVDDAGLSLTGVSASVGCRLTNLISLDLCENSMESLEASSFSTLPALTRLSVCNNQIEVVKDGALTQLPGLRHLDLSGNRLVAVPDDLFQPMPQMAEIRLANNRLAALTPGTFRGLRQLLVLDLSGNQLTSTWINSETFSGLVRLMVLDLSGNSLTQVDPSMFGDLYSLQILRLDHNQIDALLPNTFSALSNLHTLTLSSNRFHRIDALSLNGLYVLSTLALDRNYVEVVQDNAFKNISAVQELTLNGNQLTGIPEAVQNLRLLKVLDLSNNNITDIPGGVFTALEHLHTLRLEGNLISNVTKDSFRALHQLQILNLGRNRIRHVEFGAFEENKKLEVIRLDGNRLAEINGLFTSLSNLRWLNVSDNGVAHFDYKMMPKGLEWLSLKKNELVELGDYHDLAQQFEIKVLDASFNRLSTLTGKNLPKSVEQLFLNNNLITNVEQYTFFLMTGLSRVDLFANQLTHMDLNALRLNIRNGSTDLPKFYIGGNPFACDCTMDWLKRYNAVDSGLYPEIMDLDSIYCRLTFNRSQSFVPLVAADPSVFLCPYKTHCFATCHCCDFDACDCEMTCPRGCRCYHDQSWSSNIIDCSRSGFRTVPERLPMDATEVYLDGNNLNNLSSLSFLGRKNLKTLHLNKSQIHYIQNHTFSGLPSLTTLHLESNFITQLTGEEFEGLPRLRELHLQNNKLKSVANGTFASLRELEVIRLDGNQLTNMSVWELSKNPYLVDIDLGKNPWSCFCDFLEAFRGWLETSEKKVGEVDSLKCWPDAGDTNPMQINVKNGTCIWNQTTKTLQRSAIAEHLPMVVSTVIIFFFLLVVLLIAFVYRNELRIWIYSRCGVRVCYRSAFEEEQDRLFDAFVCYSDRDKTFVQHVLAPKLEFGEPRYRIALLYRDFSHGAYLADTIVEAVESSRRTIVVLSKNFLENEWCRFQFKSALHEVLKDRQKRLIVILVGEVHQRDLDPDLRLYLKTNSYVCWEDKLFWEKLRFAMPDVLNGPRTLCSVSHYSEIDESKYHQRSGTAANNSTETSWG